MDRFDPKSLTLSSTCLRKVERKKVRPPRHQPGERFLKGPIPLPWLTRAALLPGKSLHVALTLWYRAGLENRREIRLSSALTEQFGVNRFAKARALDQLESAGLIAVKQEKGCSPLVIILDARDETVLVV